jgi:hypothetical protein
MNSRIKSIYDSVVSSSFEEILRRVAFEFDTNIDDSEDELKSSSCVSSSVVSSFWEAILWGLPLTLIQLAMRNKD